MRHLALTVLTLFVAVAPSWAQQIADPSTLASLYSLTTSTSFPFPTATLTSSDAHSFIVDGWSLSKGKIQQGGSNIEFVSDPFPNKPVPTSTQNITGPVLKVKYPAGGFGSESSGMQLYSLWNTTDNSRFQSMLVTYEVAFDSNFDFLKGGKLPGLRGGPDPDGCSGGNAADGKNCFSTRLMWRKAAAGEGMFSIHTPSGHIRVSRLPQVPRAQENLFSHTDGALLQCMHISLRPMASVTAATAATFDATPTDSVQVSTVTRSPSCLESTYRNSPLITVWIYQLTRMHSDGIALLFLCALTSQ